MLFSCSVLYSIESIQNYYKENVPWHGMTPMCIRWQCVSKGHIIPALSALRAKVQRYLKMVEGHTAIWMQS